MTGLMGPRRALRYVIDHLAVPEAYILGHSFGGLVAASFALAELERVSGLILYESEVTNGPEFAYEADLNFELPVPRDLLILRSDPRRLLTDQRITRILRRQRIAHSTRSSPKPPPATARHPARSATVTSEPVTHRHSEPPINRGRECVRSRCSIDNRSVPAHAASGFAR